MWFLCTYLPVMVADLSKACIVFVHSGAGIADLNPTQVVNV